MAAGLEAGRHELGSRRTVDDEKLTFCDEISEDRTGHDSGSYDFSTG